MCGIAGIINQKDSIDYRSIVQKMLESIRYRGPDDLGIECYDDCTLGHVRLSIVDINGGIQPMFGADRQKCLCFNGEIYGFREIKREIANYPFKTDCDTEVIHALYEKYHDPQEMLKHLPGMFAFSLWDNNKRQLFSARDRFGEKPFYFAEGKNGEFIFASEIKAIIASGLVNPKINRRALSYFIKHSWMYPSVSIYENIHILPAGHYLVWLDGKWSVERYWTLPKTNFNITLEEAVEEFERLFRQAVKRQMIADVPVGAFLSGGLDSGSVVAMMSEFTSKVNTISFKSLKGFDESPLARTMAEKYGTNHIEACDTDFDIKEMLYKMQSIFDEPFADPAAISAYQISKEAAKYVKVVMSGDGGDEMLGGYSSKYRKLLYAREYKDSRISADLMQFFLKLSWARQKIFRKVKFILGADVAQTVFHGTKLNDTEIRIKGAELSKIYPDNIVNYYHETNMNFVSDFDLNAMGLDCVYDDFYFCNGFSNNPEELDNLVRCDILEYLPGDGLLKTDRTTMAVSIESRTPFLDIDLAEFCISLPFSLKVRDKTDKVVLRESMGRYWTEGIKNNIKTGFSPPWDKWLESDEVRDIMDCCIYNRNARIWDYLDYDFTSNYISSKSGWPKWIFLNLGLWFATRN